MIVFEILNDMAEDLSVLQLKKLQEVLLKRFEEEKHTSEPAKNEEYLNMFIHAKKIEGWYFSIVDVVQVLTEQPDVDGARNYWKVLKKRLKDEGNQLVTNCNQLKMKSSKDGKRYKSL